MIDKMKTKKISIPIFLSYLIDVGFIVLTVGSFFIHWVIGVLIILAWFPLGYLPGYFLREHYELKSEQLVDNFTVKSGYEAFRGCRGIVEKDLKPFGYIRVIDNQVPASSLNGYLSKGTPIKIVDIKTDKVFVLEERDVT